MIPMISKAKNAVYQRVLSRALQACGGADLIFHYMKKDDADRCEWIKQLDCRNNFLLRPDYVSPPNTLSSLNSAVRNASSCAGFVGSMQSLLEFKREDIPDGVKHALLDEYVGSTLIFDTLENALAFRSRFQLRNPIFTMDDNDINPRGASRNKPDRSQPAQTISARWDNPEWITIEREIAELSAKLRQIEQEIDRQS